MLQIVEWSTDENVCMNEIQHLEKFQSLPLRNVLAYLPPLIINSQLHSEKWTERYIKNCVTVTKIMSAKQKTILQIEKDKNNSREIKKSKLDR